MGRRTCVDPSGRLLILIGVTDSKRDKWLRWFDDPIFPEISAMYLHRHAFRVIRDMVESNKSLPPSYFFEYVEDTYAVTQSVAVRRQAECTSRVTTLGRLIREVQEEAPRLTREWWIGLWGTSSVVQFDVPGFAWEEQWAGGVGDHVDPSIPAHDLEQLTNGAAKVSDYVDQHLAHRDGRPKAGLPTFADLDASVDLLGMLYAKYGNLLTASTYPLLTPAIQHPWLDVFRHAWMPSGWEPPKAG